jgi:predicted AAA+ superfamily ATPase
MWENRYLSAGVLEDINEKMVFVGGPRQVGKTTFARNIIARHFKRPAYYNWDNRQDRRSILDSRWPSDADLILLDEIHKYNKWKTLIKGEYDKLKEKYKFLVTGSARMDIYRRGGDSMQGRYHCYRMHPLSLAELLNQNNHFELLKELPISSRFDENECEALFRFGGFPEPLLKQSSKTLRRWQNEKLERLFREDIRDTQLVRDLNSMKLLSDLLPDRVGSLLSLNSLREDLEVSHRAVSSWMDILESHYYHYRIYPFHQKRLRSIKKEPKMYLWDWSEVEKPGERFENMIAGHLYKWAHLLYDTEGYKTELYFLRNVDKKEVDFLVTVDQKPWFAVEAKWQTTEVSSSLHFYREKLHIPFVYQVIKTPGIDFIKNNIRVLSASRFLSCLA